MSVRSAGRSSSPPGKDTAISRLSPHERLESYLAVELAAWRRCYLLEAAGLLLVGLASFWAAGTAAGTASIAVLAILAGAVTLMSAFHVDRAPAFALSMSLALVSFATGLYLLGGPHRITENPAPVFAACFATKGILTVLLAAAHRRQRFLEWEWLAVSGVASLILALLVLSGLPGPFLWMFGVLFGVGILFEASARAALALASDIPRC